MTDGAPIPFTPPRVSLNRVRVVELPGIAMDEGVAGQLAFELLSVWSLIRYARERGRELALPDAFYCDTAETRWALPRFLDELLGDPAAPRYHLAEALAVRMGRNLGHVLLTLHRGDQANRDARPDWDGADWDRWADVRRVWLAGGRVSGRLGECVVASASAWLAGAGYAGALALGRSAFGGDTALIGEARYLPPGPRVALCCDYGQTSVKRALVQVEGKAIARARSLPRVVAPDEWRLAEDPARDGELYMEFVVDTVCEALALSADHGWAWPSDVMLSVAAYVDGGRLLGYGPYATMSLLAPDVRPLLAKAISERTGRPCRVHLIHDGTAAAAVFAGQPRAAVIAFGTALGVGFPPAQADHLLSIDELSFMR